MSSATSMAVMGYAVCSSLMLVVNKLAVHHLPAPSFVVLAQLICSAASVWLAGHWGYIVVDKLEMHKVKMFAPVAGAFVAAIFTNMKTLQYANVETFIVFRASTPIVISVCDYLFLNRELPSMRSWGTLVVLVLGAYGYVATDSQFHVTGYMWVVIWYFVFCFDQIYIKHAVDSVKMDSNWGRVFYTNLLASVPLVITGFSQESEILLNFEWTMASVVALAVSCTLGVAMSYFAFKCRAAISATAFTVVGNCCKIATVLINVTIWDNHANGVGLACLGVCLMSAYFYEQAPLRKAKEPVLLPL